VRRQQLDSTTLHERNKAFKLVGLQALGTLLIAVIMLISKDRYAAGASILGGAANVVPSLLFTWCLFTTTSPRAIKRMAITFYIGEYVKLLASALLVAALIIKLPNAMLPILLGFIGAQMGFWLAPIFIGMNEQKSS
jgi:ATP synthase protein I